MVTIGNFLADPALDELYEMLTKKAEKTETKTDEKTDAQPAETVKAESENVQEKNADADQTRPSIIIADGIKLGQKPVTKEEAIQAAGELLEKLGYVDGSYVEAMQERERLVSTYIGMGVAIPHGTTQAKGTVKKTGIVFMQYPEGVDFGAEKAQLVFGIAGIGDEHLEILSNLCTLLEDPERLEKLKTTKDIDWVLEQLA